MKKGLILLLVLPFLTMIYSCDSISERSRKKAEAFKTKLVTADIAVKDKETAYKKYLKSVPSEVAKYSTIEKLDDNFKAATNLIVVGDNIYKRVEVILKNDESKSEPTLLTNLTNIDNLISNSKTTSEYPKKRMMLLTDIYNNADKFKEGSEKNRAIAEGELADLKLVTSKYYSKYPTQKTAIDGMVKKGVGLVSTAITYNDSVDSNYKKKADSSGLNLSVFGDSYERGGVVAKNMVTHNKDSKKLLAELDKSHTKILKDMKVLFYVQVGRTTWDSYSDFGGDHNYTYSMREVDEETFKYFDGLPETVVLASGETNPSVKVNKGMWDKLKINTSEKLHSGDDDGEYWLNNTVAKYYHNYVVESDGKVIDKSEWVEVDEDKFYTNLENLGMSIYSKPLGSFESEAIEYAAPAGLTYVDNPKYGQWKTDASGNNFWAFYGQYMFLSQMMGGHNYSRAEYRDYNSNYRGRNRNYYGSGGSHNYGTRGTTYTKSKTYASSNYKKSYAGSTKSSFGHSNLKKSYRPSTGSAKTSSRSQTSSSRTGSARRGGGPGGGGK